MADDRPNFLIIMTDQQRGDCLSAEDHPCLLTPNMDHIGHRGTRFTRAYTTCPSCIPARRSLMSGQYPATNGMVGYADGVEWNPAATMPGELRKAGYQTAIVGRNMHLWPPDKQYGFTHMKLQDGRDGHVDDYEQFLRSHEATAQSDYYGIGINRAHGISGNGWTARPWHMDEAAHPTTWTVSEAVRWLRHRDSTEPYFMVTSFIAPHPPLVPPAFYFDRYLRADIPDPAIGDWAEPPPNGGKGMAIDADWVNLKGEAMRSCRAGYYGLINHIDDQIYRLLFDAGSSGAMRNTVVIFTADHGEMLGDHYLFRKCYPFEASARIPMMMYATADLGFKPQTVADQPVCLEDIMPTVLDLAGCEIPEGVDGRSLAPLLRGEKDTEWRPYLHGEHARCYRKEQSNHYLTDGHMKYVWMTEAGTELLFDIDNDPNELKNLAADAAHHETLTRWRSRMIRQLQDRPEGFTDGKALIAGRPHEACLPHVHGVPA